MKIKSIFTLLFAMLLCLAVPVSAQEENTVTLRIEGINGNLYYGSVVLPDEANVAEVIITADNASDKITVVGVDAGYITDINGELAGTFGGWDGWMYRVNNTEPSVGIGEYSVNPGDVIVIYYSDAYGVGMQYPEMDISDIANGVIKFTSEDITYDENFNATVTENPVTDMKVMFDNTEYVTDKDGKIQIDSSALTPGNHNISVSKTAENGAPLVLRLAPDTTVNIPEPTPDESLTQTDNNGENDNNDDNGFNPAFLIPVFAAVIIAVGGAVFVAVKKKK